MKRILTALLLATSVSASAQVMKEMFVDETNIDSLPERSLRIELDAVGFFHDNEYDSEVQNGYTLPGGRLIPRIAYNPIKQINIEAGASMLFYDGANKYPCYAYHDIGVWKGDQYQHGVHALPWLRLQASLKNVDIILGNIYGGSNHRLITPLYNPEQNISADPEMGLQVLWRTSHVHLDAWVNWQSYLFDTETHQEAFTVGAFSKVLWGNKGYCSFYTPIQLVVQHRGGEQDATNYGVQTISNVSMGVGAEWKPQSTFFNGLEAQLNGIVSYQQAGQLWPFEKGAALHIGLQSKWWNHLNVGIDYLNAPKQFVSVYGNPFYSTISLKHGGTTVTADGNIVGQYDHVYDGLQNIRIGIDYQYTFAKAYTLGVAAEVFSINSRKCLNDAQKLNEACFSFGTYLRVNPSILLKKF